MSDYAELIVRLRDASRLSSLFTLAADAIEALAQALADEREECDRLAGLVEAPLDGEG